MASAPPASGGKNLSFNQSRRLAAAKGHEFSLVSEFKQGYRNREDITNLPPGVLIKGSQNVLTNVSERIQMRQGYSLDGDVSSLNAPVISSFDWLTRGNSEKHMRAGGETVVGSTTNLVANGTFAGNDDHWIVGAGWAYGGNKEVHTPGNTEFLLQSGISMTTGRTYQLSFTVSGRSAGQVSTQVGNTGGDVVTSDGNYSQIITPGVANGNILFTPNTDFDGAISNVSLLLLGNGNLQYRYVDSDGVVTWRELMENLPTVSFNFAKYWNIAESLRETVFVNGTPNIFRWNGATAVIASTTGTTITKTGTESWLDAGFYASAGSTDKKIVINGNQYSYTGGEATTTLTGVSGDPTGEANGSIVHQQVVTTPNSAMTGIPATFPNSLIETLNNQVFVGSTQSSTMYVSMVNSYTDYSSSNPRQSGEGAVLILDDNLVGFKPQESYMYVTAGQDLWYNVNFQLQTSTVGVTYEQVNALPLKTGRRQAAISQAFLSHMKNNIIVVTQETTIDTFGRVESSLATPQTTNLSDPIKLDVDSYDFTDGSIAYHRFYIYVAVPKEGIVLVYNLATKSWEAPQTLPISRFYIVDGELYGHSYFTFESYKLFTGYADRVYPGFNGFPISAVAKFSYQNYGSRSVRKHANYLYVEGYISPNTTLTATLTYELDGCATTRNLPILGNNARYVCLTTDSASLGKTSLGKQPLGGGTSNSINGLPPKFRVEKSFNNTPFFEQSTSFSCLGTNQRFEILAFGLNAGMASEEPISIRD